MTRVFLDGIGFRDAGLRLGRPLAVKGSSGRTLTVTQLVSTPESSVLVYEVEWQGEQNIHPQSDRVVLHGASTDPACRPGGLSMSVRAGKLVVSRTMPPVADGIRDVEVEIVGDAGEWRIPLALEPFGDIDVARAIDASDTWHGITVGVRGIAQRPDATILDITIQAGPRRRIEIGGLNGLRDETTAMRLRDERGRVYPERVRQDARDQFPDPPGQDVGVFDPLPPDTGAIVLEVPFVTVHDYGASVDVPLPVTSPVDMTLAGAPLRVVRTHADVIETPHHQGNALAVEVESEWLDDHRIVCLSSARLDGVDRGVMHGGIYAPAPELKRELKIANDAPDAARTLTLGSPQIQISGPWRVALDTS